MLLSRYLDVDSALSPGKALLLLGPRRSGKTTLLQQFLESTEKSIAFYRGDEISVQNNFSVSDSSQLSQLVGENDVLVIDEAQMIPNIGKSLKLIVDTMPELSVVATGSSTFELTGQLGEPLTGRKNTHYLLPIAVNELLQVSKTPQLEIQDNLNNLMIYGMYPNVLTTKLNSEKATFLRELVDSYLLKDILEFQNVKGARVLLQLLNLLAYQIGSEVSLSELGSSLNIDRKTVERYIDLLEKTYVIFRLSGYSRNLRSEVTKMSKYYFYDNGIRNALINNYNNIDIRNDIGQLWENFVVSERQKKRLYYGPSANQYFWRTRSGEIDLVEEFGGKLHGYEFKWSDKKSVKKPREFLDGYKGQATWQVITPKDLYDFTKS